MSKGFKILSLIGVFLFILVIGKTYFQSSQQDPDYDKLAEIELRQMQKNSTTFTSTSLIKMKIGDEIKGDLVGNDNKPDISLKRNSTGLQIKTLRNFEQPYLTIQYDGKSLKKGKNNLNLPYLSFFDVKVKGVSQGAFGEISESILPSYVADFGENSKTYTLQIVNATYNF